MSHRLDEKQARRAERLRQEQEARRREQRQRLMRRLGYWTVGAIAVLLVVFAVLGGGGNRAGGSSSADPMSPSGSSGGPAIGAIAPNFKLTDVVSNEPVTRVSLAGHKTLLFFSEGVGCQACMVQTADLQKNGALTKAGVRLVSITTDPPDQLRQAAGQYGIRTPLLADPTTTMSGQYGMLAHGGMEHAGQDGHAFMLLDANGRVLWHQAYQEMYVDPTQLLKDMGVKA